jgi:hypothetical protein
MDDGLAIDAAATAGNDVRKAALLLHTLSDLDRNWMLERLPAQHRRQLLDLVEELHGLGIPASQALLDAVKDDTTAGRAPICTPADDSWESRCAEIDRAGPSAVWPILRDEPEHLIARVMAVRDWSWAPAIAQWLDPLQRSRVKGLLERGRPSTYADAQAMNAYLLSRLSERIRALPPDIHSATSSRSSEALKPVPRRTAWRWPSFGRDRESIR